MISVPWNETLLDLLRRLQEARRLRLALNTLLVLTIAHGLAVTTWLMVPAPRPGPPPAANPIVSSPAPGATGLPSVAEIAALHLFGVALPNQARANAVNAPETTLQLVLQGVLAATDAQAARAIISAPNVDQKPYRVGDLLPGNAILKEIYPDRVLLERNGHYETLRLPQDQSVVGISPSSAFQPAASDAGVAQELRAYRDQLVRNPQSIFQLLRLVPARQGGQFLGFRVYPSQDRALFTRLGLHPGDLITSVNGIALNDPRNGIEVLSKLRTANNIEVSLQRNGAPQTLAINLNQ
ncbi:MAG: type II secretion system protein GspC [Gammaproteobacteria bacterium]